MPESIVEHGMPRNGTTTERPSDRAFGGALFFDETVGIQLVWNSGSQEWNAASVGRGTTAQRPAANAVPQGTPYYNDTVGALQISDGASWIELAVTDNQSSSSSSSSESSSSTQSSSSSASSESSSSTSSSSQS